VTALIVHCTVPDPDVADRIARVLVEEGLAACVNRLPGVVSTYAWRGEIMVDVELLLLIKTTRSRFDALSRRIVELHPYELPEIIGVDVALGNGAYLDWIAQSTSAR
jgi:periplasmic divalent cation tolerance protein